MLLRLAFFIAIIMIELAKIIDKSNAMNPEFWQQRWQAGRIGFNQPQVNPLLINYFAEINLPAGSRIFAPLCGKSIDMLWLTEQGYDVVGVELVESAVQAFFAEQNILPTVIEHVQNSSIKCYQGSLKGQTITLWVGDIFALTTTHIGQVNAVYDRAALIAMPPEMRLKYSEQVIKLSNNAPQLLLTLNYNQEEWAGPPFSISSEQVQQYYSEYYEITELEGGSSTLNANPEMTVTEHIWLLQNNRGSR